MSASSDWVIGGHDAEPHQGLDDLGRAGGHAVGQFLHGDLVGKNDVAHDFHLIGAQPLQFRLPPFALALAADRSERADPLVLALDRGLHVDAAGTAAVVGGLPGRDHGGFAGGRAGTGAARGAGVVVFLAAAAQPQGFGGRGRRGRRGRAGAAARVLAGTGAPGGRARGGGGGGRGRRGGCRRGAGGGTLGLGGLGRGLGGGGFALGRFFGFVAGRFLGGAGFFLLAPAGFLGGGEDGDLLLLAPFRLAPRGFLLLFDQDALAGCQFGRGQRAGGARRGAPAAGAATAAAALRGPGRGARGALLAHLDLHHFRAAMAEALPDRAGIDRPSDLQSPRRPQRQPALARVLILAVAHHPACRAVPVRLSAVPALLPPT